MAGVTDTSSASRLSDAWRGQMTPFVSPHYRFSLHPASISFHVYTFGSTLLALFWNCTKKSRNCSAKFHSIVVTVAEAASISSCAMRLCLHFTYLLALQFLATACLFTTSADASAKSRNPLNYISVLESSRISTPSHRVNAFSQFDLTFSLHQHTQKIRLALEPNYDIIHEDAHVTYLDRYGNVRNSEKIDRMAHRVYQGSSYIVQEDGSSVGVGWARVFVKKDGKSPLFEGTFTVTGDHHHIYTKSSFMATKHAQDPHLEESHDEYMVVWRDTDVSRQTNDDHTQLKRETGLTCGSDALEFNKNPKHALYRGMMKRSLGSWGYRPVSNLFAKRQTHDEGGWSGNSADVSLRSTIGSTAGCPTTRKVALIGIATDCTYTASFRSTDELQHNIITQINSASNLYQSTFNITLGLGNMTVSDRECPGSPPAQAKWNAGCAASTSITDRLNAFSQWRDQHGDSNAYWSLWTTCNTGPVVGLAWLGQLCNGGSKSRQDTSGGVQTVTGANVVARTSTEWQVFAHETGHTFGAVHDCDSTSCSNPNTAKSGQCCPVSSTGCDAQAQYLMNPFSSPGITRFSPCSVGNICSALGRKSVQSNCLSDNKGVVTITGHQCGNGIVEDGEDCDCGGPVGCAGNTCCNPSTCKFNTGAVCDRSSEECCTARCQYAASGTVCRASTGQCDPQEVCSGTNSTCPEDHTAKDGTNCGDGLRCASGQCTSRNLQCKILMASYTSGNETYACNNQTCNLSCVSPNLGANMCYSMQRSFLNGTPCAGGGHCENGVCSGSTVGGQGKSWIDDNKNVVIAVASALGGIMFLAILACCVRARWTPRRKKMTTMPGAGKPKRGMNGNGPRRYCDGAPETSQTRDHENGGVWQPECPQGPLQQTSWEYPSSPPPAYGGHGGGRRTIRYA